MKNRVMIIGIDGATWRILRPMMDAGRLPNIERLYSEGASGTLISTIPPLTPAAFASFHTGVNPGKHGITDFRLYEKATGTHRLVDSTTLKYKSFSEILSVEGKTIVSINIPLTYPPKRLKGVVIGDFLSPKVYPGFVYPGEIFNNILEKSNYRIVGVPLKQKSHLSTDEIIKDYIDVESTRYKIARILMKRYDWDLFLIHNQSLDAVQHAFFHFLDRSSSDYSDEKYNIVVEFYESMDKEIGEILGEIDNRTTVILFSDHGFKLIRKNVSVNAFLQKTGYMKRVSQRKRILTIGKVKRFIEKFDSMGIRYSIYRLLGIDSRVRANLALKYYSKNNTFEDSQAFMINGCYFGNIYLNNRFSDNESLKRGLLNALKELRDPLSGEKVVSQYYISDNIFKGPYTDSMPYLFLEPSGDYSFIPGIDKNEIFSDIDYERDNSGGHALEGVITVWGGNVRKVENIRCNILDIAPTVLAILGIEAPAYMDGKVLEELFYERPAVKMKSFMDGDVGESGDSRDYMSGDEEMIRERLKDLGYF